ncbi:MAG: bile acid:sodium symporter family protein [Bacteroidales bacterium]
MINRFVSLLARVGLNFFFLALLSMILLAWLFPRFGLRSSPVPVHLIAEYGVSVIFFFYGLRLSPEKLKAGLSNWKLHLIIQSSTFILFPLLLLLANALFNHGENSLLWLGAFYLAALPSTVSSSVVLVSIAGGNLPAAIFNASISSIIGIFITPVWMSIFIQKTTADFDLTRVILKLMLEILLPVVLGILLHRKFGAWAEKYKTGLRNLDQFIILMIVYTAFCESFAGKMFDTHPGSELFLLGFLMLTFFAFMFGLMYLLARFAGFSRPDRITLLFCGSKKSLVQGAVMGRVLFPDPVILGVILLPLMMYHALQLLAGSTIAQAMSKKS